MNFAFVQTKDQMSVTNMKEDDPTNHELGHLGVVLSPGPGIHDAVSYPAHHQGPATTTWRVEEVDDVRSQDGLI